MDLGNVSEWLFTDGVFENEPVKYTGHFNDRLNTIYSVPVRELIETSAVV